MKKVFATVFMCVFSCCAVSAFAEVKNDGVLVDEGCGCGGKGSKPKEK